MTIPTDPIYKYQPLFGSWNIEEEIGEGSFGIVYRVSKVQLGQTYISAVKIITIPSKEQYREAKSTLNMDDNSLHGYFQEIVENIIHEVNILHSLSGNSNILTYHDHNVVEHDDKIGWDILIRMEYITPLTKYLKGKNLSREQVIQLGVEICSALELCSRKGIIHRDIKDENIFVSEDGVFKLGDFGIARELSGSGRAASMRGTPLYMAPEVYRGEKYNAAVDIYSLGIVLYKLLNHGRMPFMPQYPTVIKYKDSEEALDRRMSGGEALPLPENADEKLGKVVLKACAFRPEDRYAVASEMKRDLTHILLELSPEELAYKTEDPIVVKEQKQWKEAIEKEIPSGTVSKFAGLDGVVINDKKMAEEEPAINKTASIFGGLGNNTGSEYISPPQNDFDKTVALPQQMPIIHNETNYEQSYGNGQPQTTETSAGDVNYRAQRVPEKQSPPKSWLVLIGVLAAAFLFMIVLFIGAYSYFSRENASANAGSTTQTASANPTTKTTVAASESVQTTTTSLTETERVTTTMAVITAALPNGDADPESYILQLNQRYISAVELDRYTQEQIAYIRNGIFALSGRVFVKEKFSQYFYSKSWYVPNSNAAANTDTYIETIFNVYQAANRDVCVDYETAHGWR